jgi:hypothetical protein
LITWSQPPMWAAELCKISSVSMLVSAHSMLAVIWAPSSSLPDWWLPKTAS